MVITLAQYSAIYHCIAMRQLLGTCVSKGPSLKLKEPVSVGEMQEEGKVEPIF